MREMTEDEQQTLRAGLRIVARMIARRHLARQAAEGAEAMEPDDDAESATSGGVQSGVER
ncbi:MAG: hypothetical protein F4038_01955 [Chloroflexi bacterium]|nr:hypothetical protein [Chloroflexota bacterium]MYJ91805.1 hypothetical protein [Chloroflexota bacterium]